MSPTTIGGEVASWYYWDAKNNSNKGPMTSSMLKRLLYRNIIPMETMVWNKADNASDTTNTTTWHPLHSIAPFKDYCIVLNTSWYYSPQTKTEAQQRIGPIPTRELLKAYERNEVALVWDTKSSAWCNIEAISDLSSFCTDIKAQQVAAAERKESKYVVQQQEFSASQEKSSLLVAENGQAYVYENESKRWLTPAEKVQDELEMLSELQESFKDEQERNNNMTLAVDTTTQENASKTVVAEKKKKKRKKKSSDRWTRAKVNTWIYVTGLPLDSTVDEVTTVFSKCGVIQTDLHTGLPRIKLYKKKDSDTDSLNGDASICYIKEASIDLAIQLLDGTPLRVGSSHNMTVAAAVFSQKGETFVKQDRGKIDQKVKIRKLEQEKALSWSRDDDDNVGLPSMRIIVFKHMFTLKEKASLGLSEEEVADLSSDVQQECQKYGAVEKVTVMDQHVDGVIVVKLKSASEASLCVEKMNNRFFGGQQISVSLWDGTDYTPRKETTEEIKARVDEFGKWLEEGSEESEEEEEEEDDVLPIEAHSGRVLPDLDDISDSD